MPVDPDCDTGDCDDEPPDPEPGCNFREDCYTGAVRNFYSEGDPVDDAIEILENKYALYPEMIWIRRQYPEPLSQCTWLADWGRYVASDHILVEEYSEAYPYPFLTFDGTMKGSGSSGGVLPDITLGNTLNGSVYGPASYGNPFYGINSTLFSLQLYLYDGSNNVVDYYTTKKFMIIQHGGIRKDGQCIYRARKFGPYDNYAAYETALASFPEIPAYGTFEGWGAGQLPPFTVDGYAMMGETQTADLEYAVTQIYPWDFEVVVPLPIEGFFEIEFPSEWFSEGLDGVTIKLSSFVSGAFAYNTGAPSSAIDAYCPAFDTFNLSFTGKPSWLASDTLTSPGCELTTVNTARTLQYLYPEGVYGQPNLRSVTKTASNVPVTLCKPLLDGFTNTGYLEFIYRGGECANTAVYTYSDSPTQTYTDSETACTVIGPANVEIQNYSVAYFVPDMAISPQTNHSLSVINGTWYVYREENTTYTFTHRSGGVPNGSPFWFFEPLANPISIRSGTLTIGATAPAPSECICFVYGTNAAGYDHVPQAPGNVIPPEVISFWLANDLELVAGNCSSHAYPDLPCFCDGACFYKRNASHTGYDLYHPDDYLKGCRKTEEQVLAGLSTTMPVLKPTPCMPEDCAGHVATWIAEPTGKKKSDGYYKVKWTLVDDCPGTCCTEPPKEPTRIKKSIMVETPCKCDCD